MFDYVLVKKGLLNGKIPKTNLDFQSKDLGSTMDTYELRKTGVFALTNRWSVEKTKSKNINFKGTVHFYTFDHLGDEHQWYEWEAVYDGKLQSIKQISPIPKKSELAQTFWDKIK